jgi:hypothetical protein
VCIGFWFRFFDRPSRSSPLLQKREALSVVMWSILCGKLAYDQGEFQSRHPSFSLQIIPLIYFEYHLKVKVAKAPIFFWSSAQNYAFIEYLERSYLGP